MTNILIVDDAATVRMYHRKVLADAGWHIEEACNGVEALERVFPGPIARNPRLAAPLP